MAQLNEDFEPTAALFTASDLMSAFGIFEQPNLYDDCTSFLFDDYPESCPAQVMPPSSYSVAVGREATAECSMDPTFESPTAESFGIFGLELDFAWCPITQDPIPASFDVAHEPAAPRSTKPQVLEERESRQPMKKRRKAAKTPKHSSQRQREEIQSLRATAVQLERELKRVSTISDQRSPPVRIEVMQRSSSSGEATVQQLLLWESVAKRQEEAKLRAEQQNADLRSELQAKIKVAKSLEQRLLLRTRMSPHA